MQKFKGCLFPTAICQELWPHVARPYLAHRSEAKRGVHMTDS